MATKQDPSASTTATSATKKVSSENLFKKHHRGRRGSRRRSFSGNNDDNNRFKKEESNSDDKNNDNDESPALQSVNDIIAEMRRLPNTGGDQQWTTVPYSRRGRRHSEPFHHHNHHNQQQQEEQQTRCDSIISTNTTFSHHPLEATFSQHQQQHDETNTEQIKHAVDGHLNSPKRVRSQSLPGHFNKPPLPHQQQQSNERRPLYSSHIPIPDAIHQIQQRKLFSGMLSVDSQDSSDAFVVACEELDNDDIYIYGSRNRNRALDGDYVAIELVDVDTMLSEKASKKQARRRSSLATATLHSIPEETAFGGERIKDSLIEQQKEKPKYCGKVVSILERPKRMLFSGTLSLERPSSTATPTTPTGLILPSLFQLPSPTTTQYNSSSHQQQYHKPSIIWLVPADKRLPLVAVPAKHAPYGFVKYHEEFRHRIFIGSIQRWPVTSLHPFGTIEREIGLMGELNVHSQALMADNHLKDYCEFTKGVLKSADAVEEEEEVSIKRRDLRDLPIFTVKDDQWQQEDPLIDHGFSIKMIKQQDADGLGELYEIGIHTIDVGSLIRPNTLLDREARDRGVTVQLVERQIPMLPPSFTNAHAELAPGKERAALSVLCRVTRSGKFIHSWVGKTIIKSDTHLENNKVPQDMLDACKTLQIKRIEQDGGDSLSMTYQKFQTSDSTGGYPESVVRIHRSDDHPLVLLKEAAILAGQEVAKKITSRLPEHALLYHQPKQLCYDSTTAKNHNKEVKEDYKRDPHNRPTYFCSGNMDITRYEHYPYAAPLYTVFSEPLHRYGCIAVQRQLHSVLDKSTSSIAKNKAINEDDDDNSNSNKRNIDMIDKLARHCNAKEYARDTAYEQSVFLYNAAYIYRQCLDKKQPFLIKEATVLSLQPSHHSIVVSIPDYGITKEIYLALNKNIQTINYNSKNNTMELVWEQKHHRNSVPSPSNSTVTGTTTTILQSPPAILKPTEEQQEGEEQDELIFTVEQQDENQYQTMVIRCQSQVNVRIRSDMKVIRPGLDIQLVNDINNSN